MSDQDFPSETTKLVTRDLGEHAMSTGTEGSLRGDVLIIFQTLCLPITFIITYFVATSLGHVEKEFPYISDTGTWPPESCIFGLLLSFYSISSFLSVFIRWKIVRQTAGLTNVKVNNLTFGLGIVAALGVLLVANFQETSQIIVHLVGAAMAFYIGTVYMWGQTILTWKLPELPGYFRKVFYIRLLLTLLATLSAVLIGPFAGAAFSKYSGNGTKTHEPGTGKWDSALGGYNLHLASVAFEWALAGLVTLYFLTFVREFRFVRFGLPSVSFKGEHLEKQEYEGGL